MHAGKLTTSPRLRATLSAINERWQTTREISQRTESMAVHSDIAALRANGIAIERKCIGRTENGNQVWAYKATIPKESHEQTV
jgi:hypothetical protein